jgi:leucyl-tRNA synthetase
MRIPIIGAVREYDFREIESKWQARWDEQNLYRTGVDRSRPKFYCLDFFPYPSGDGLSVGHCRNYIPTDLISRYHRMGGFNVLHPMGWDAFGLPAENEAILKGKHPRVTVPKYIGNYKRQLKLIGTSYDWEREVDSSAPEYYRWTQWFFLLFYKRGLAYRALAPANWCPKCETVLANEEVEGGCCWRCGAPVTKKDLEQWFLRITAYAEDLLKDLETIDWPEPIVLMQKNWIGRSEGVRFELKVKETDGQISVFTTRPDTIYGMSFVVLAPEHPLVRELTKAEHRSEVEEYVKMAQRETEIERLSADRKPTGVFTGSYAINPMNGNEIPIYVADYVLMGYGTGAIMSVPAHDVRDFEFAKDYSLPVRVVVAPADWDGSELQEAYVDEGTLVDSGPFSGLSSEEANERIADYMEENGFGCRAVYYRMRDWLISRQRYWGAPIPVVYCDQCGTVPVREDELPVLLPDVDEYVPSGTGRSPLASVPGFVKTQCPGCGGPAERETDTMGGFACSSWYFLRFASPRWEDAPFNPEDVGYWLPVDLYVGGAEHAVMHLLYARFWTKVMYDAGMVEFREPFQKLKNQGVVHAPDGRRMSKSAGNVITPDSVVEKYGADTLRIYELFMAPFEQGVNWSDEAIGGAYRFLKRVWRFVMERAESFDSEWRNGLDSATLCGPEEAVRRKTHHTIKKVDHDVAQFKFNTAIAAMMEWLNELYHGELSRHVMSEAVESMIVLLAPFAPHVAEELWEAIGKPESVHLQRYPEWDEALASSDKVTVIVQINGRLRDRLRVPAGTGEEALKQMVFESERINRFLQGKKVRKVIVVPEKVVNLVIK